MSLGSHDAPATTGSVAAAPVQVQRPLPQSLAYSDAAKIGQAAAAALWQADAAQPAEWVNSATGSSGTVENGAAAAASPEAPEACRTFSTIVTSIGGVHRYAGEVCRGENGRSVVQIEPPAEASSS